MKRWPLPLLALVSTSVCVAALDAMLVTIHSRIPGTRLWLEVNGTTITLSRPDGSGLRPIASAPIAFVLFPALFGPIWFAYRCTNEGRGISFFAQSRVSKGLCPQCGYDLRESPDRCPECGSRRFRTR